MPRGRKRKITDPLTESSKPRRRRRVKAEPGTSSDPDYWPSEDQKPSMGKVEAIDLQQETGSYTFSTLHGHSYPNLYAKDGKRVVLE
jgi:hypothetical protein